MADWMAYVRERLQLPGITPEREAEIVEEVARQLEDAYAEARSEGASPEQALERARRHIENWDALAAELVRTQRRHQVPAIDRYLDTARPSARNRKGMGSVLGGLWRDVLYGVRLLVQRPSFSVIVALTLALGIGANTAIYTVVHAVLIRPLPYPGAERVVMVWTSVPEKGLPRFATSPADFADWRARNRVFEELALFALRGGSLQSAQHAERVRYSLTSPSLFRVLASDAQLGRTFREEENQPGQDDVVVLSHGFWQQHFGADPQILGRPVVLDGETLTVVGVMPPWFTFPSPEVRLWKPLGESYDPVRERANYWALSAGRLAQGVTLEQAETEMRAIAAELAEEHPINKGITVLLEPLIDAAVGRVRPVLLILWGTVGLVLLIACANAANLLLARSSTRLRELAVRASLGAGRGALARQLLIESLLLALAGGTSGLLLAGWGVPLLLRLSAGSLPRVEQIAIDGPVLAFTLGLSLATGILFGVLPALRMTRIDLTGALKEGGGSATARRDSGSWEH